MFDRQVIVVESIDHGPDKASSIQFVHARLRPLAVRPYEQFSYEAFCLVFIGSQVKGHSKECVEVRQGLFLKANPEALFLTKAIVVVRQWNLSR